jgi:hypothetical protein
MESETRSLISAPETATRGVVTVAEKWKSGVVGLNASFVRSQIDRRRSLRSCVVWTCRALLALAVWRVRSFAVDARRRRVVSRMGAWKLACGTSFPVKGFRLERITMSLYSMYPRAAMREDSLCDVRDGRLIDGGRGCPGWCSYDAFASQAVVQCCFPAGAKGFRSGMSAAHSLGMRMLKRGTRP